MSVFQINGENVVRASHDRVVHLIRGTGDTLAMKVVTVKPAGRAQDWFAQQDKAMTMPNRKKKGKHLNGEAPCAQTLQTLKMKLKLTFLLISLCSELKYFTSQI